MLSDIFSNKFQTQQGIPPHPGGMCPPAGRIRYTSARLRKCEKSGVDSRLSSKPLRGPSLTLRLPVPMRCLGLSNQPAAYRGFESGVPVHKRGANDAPPFDAWWRERPRRGVCHVYLCCNSCRVIRVVRHPPAVLPLGIGGRFLVNYVFLAAG